MWDRGDVVLATARNDPRYVFLWLACGLHGRRSTWPWTRARPQAELEGMVGQVEPKLIVTDDEAAEPVRAVGSIWTGPGPAEPDDAAVLIPTSGTTGRSKLVTPNAPRVRDGGRGLPVVAGA